jgi:hypothetical protein
MFSKSKVSQSMIDAVNSVLGEKSEEKIVKNVLLDEASEKVPTPTGMKVYGSNYGNSMKARKDQTSHEIDKVKEPKDKELAKEELKGNQHKIDANNNGEVDAHDFKILRGKKKVKEEMTFAEKLINSLQEKKDVVMPEDSTTPVKNQDVADKSYLKDKPGSVKSDLKNLGRFLTGKKETNEEVVTEENEGKITHIVPKSDLQKHKDWMDSEGFDTVTKPLPKSHPKHKTHIGIVSNKHNSLESSYHEDGYAHPIKEEVELNEDNLGAIANKHGM